MNTAPYTTIQRAMTFTELLSILALGSFAGCVLAFALTGRAL